MCIMIVKISEYSRTQSLNIKNFECWTEMAQKLKTISLTWKTFTKWRFCLQNEVLVLQWISCYRRSVAIFALCITFCLQALQSTTQSVCVKTTKSTMLFDIISGAVHLKLQQNLLQNYISDTPQWVPAEALLCGYNKTMLCCLSEW